MRGGLGCGGSAVGWVLQAGRASIAWVSACRCATPPPPLSGLLTAVAIPLLRLQAALLRRMIDGGIDAILVKIAAAGLTPAKHLGAHLAALPAQVRLEDMPEWAILTAA